MDSKAVALIKYNIENNKSQDDGDLMLTVYQEEASKLLYSNMKAFDVVDLDPYGTAIPLIDSAVQAVKNGGLLLVTFTDMQVLCGNYPETLFYKYGSICLKTPYCHEVFT